MMEEQTPIKDNKYLCTRPMLASELQVKGRRAEKMLNPWHPDRAAWSFEITDELRADVLAYYERIGQDAPRIIRKNDAERKRFTMLVEWKEQFDKLDDVEAGRLIKALFAYAKDGTEAQLNADMMRLFTMYADSISGKRMVTA